MPESESRTRIIIDTHPLIYFFGITSVIGVAAFDAIKNAVIPNEPWHLIFDGALLLGAGLLADAAHPKIIIDTHPLRESLSQAPVPASESPVIAES